MNSLDKMEEIDRLARLCEAKDAEIARLNESFAEIQHNQAAMVRDGQQQLSEAQAQIAMLRNKIADIAATFLVEHMLRMGAAGVSMSVTVDKVAYKVWCGINTELEDFKKEFKEKGTIKEAYLEQQLSEAQAQVAMQADALAECDAKHSEYSECCPKLVTALSATAETVAAWRAKETEPLRREVAMLRELLQEPLTYLAVHGWDVSFMYSAISDTQATALAYEREVKAKALEEAAHKIMFTSSDAYGVVQQEHAEAASWLHDIAADIRANKGE